MARKNNIFSKRTLKLTSNKYKKVDTEKELRREINRIFSLANKRIKRIDDSKRTSQAINTLKRQGIEFFKSRGKSIGELTQLYHDAMSFINNPTSTISGIKEYSKFYSEKYGIDASLVDSVIDIQGNDIVYDYLFFISIKDWYAIQSGYTTVENFLYSQGFTENPQEFSITFEKETNENRTVLLKRITSDDDNIMTSF